MFAILSACISFSVEWGGDLTGGFICDLFKVDENDLGNLHRAIQLKMVTIILCIGMIRILPLNSEINDLNQRMNQVNTPYTTLHSSEGDIDEDDLRAQMIFQDEINLNPLEEINDAVSDDEQAIRSVRLTVPDGM